MILEVDAPLLGLMGGLVGPSQVVARGSALPNFDLHCPLLNLPLAMKTCLETILARTPYLHVSP